MVSNLKSIEVSLEKLEICPKQVVTAWVYGAIKVTAMILSVHYN